MLEGVLTVHVGVGNATEGSFYEEGGAPGQPNGHDGVISPITPIDQMTHTFTQNYRAEERTFNCTKNCSEEQIPEFRNVPSKFEGGQLAALETKLAGGGETSDWGASSEEITNVNTVEGNAEIKG